MPALTEVFDFFHLIFSKSQLENECIIIALIYCERLVKETKGRLCIRYDNWRSMYENLPALSISVLLLLFPCSYIFLATSVCLPVWLWRVKYGTTCLCGMW